MLWQGFPALWDSRLTFDRTQRRAIDQFDYSRAMVDKRLHRRAGRAHIGKDHERGQPVLIIWDGLEHSLGNERQRALGADHQAAENFKRSSAIEKRLHVIASGILDAELFAQSRHELRVCLNLTLDLHQAGGERRLGGRELLLGILAAAVYEGA